jgi:hypothetical protein
MHQGDIVARRVRDGLLPDSRLFSLSLSCQVHLTTRDSSDKTHDFCRWGLIWQDNVVQQGC